MSLRNIKMAPSAEMSSFWILNGATKPLGLNTFFCVGFFSVCFPAENNLPKNYLNDLTSRELKRRQNQVDQEKSRLEEMSSKVTKFKNLQELNEKHEKELKAKLNEISRELEWETITDFSPSAIEECKEQIDDTEKTFENEKVEMETKFKANLENQQEKIR